MSLHVLAQVWQPSLPFMLLASVIHRIPPKSQHILELLDVPRLGFAKVHWSLMVSIRPVKVIFPMKPWSSTGHYVHE